MLETHEVTCYKKLFSLAVLRKRTAFKRSRDVNYHQISYHVISSSILFVVNSSWTHLVQAQLDILSSENLYVYVDGRVSVTLYDGSHPAEYPRKLFELLVSYIFTGKIIKA